MRFDGASPYNDARFNSDFVRQEYWRFKADFTDRNVVIVTDGWVGLTGLEVILFPADRAQISTLAENSLFLLAFDNDEIGALAVRTIVSASGKYVPVRVWGMAHYYHKNLTWREVAHREYIEQQRLGYAKWDVADFDNLAQAIDLTANISGAYVEIGCYRGSSGCAALAYMAALGLPRSCWFFDVFDGFNYVTASTSADAVWRGTHETEGQEAVSERLARFASDKLKTHIRKLNIVTDDLPDESIALCNIDVDMYEAVLAALEKCAPRMNRGGIMIVEDPGHTPGLIGAQVALEDFKSTSVAREFLDLYMGSQHFLIRY